MCRPSHCDLPALLYVHLNCSEYPCHRIDTGASDRKKHWDCPLASTVSLLVPASYLNRSDDVEKSLDNEIHGFSTANRSSASHGCHGKLRIACDGGESSR